MRKTIIAGLLTGAALFGAATAHADPESFSYQVGERLSMAASSLMYGRGLGPQDACALAVTRHMQLGDVDAMNRSDFNPREAVAGCIAWI